jgi:hypothetical protein
MPFSDQGQYVVDKKGLPEAEAGEETLDQMYQISAGCLGDLAQKILGLTVQSRRDRGRYHIEMMRSQNAGSATL